MNIFKKIKSDLDEQIAKDVAERKREGIYNENFSLRTFIRDLIDGRILTRRGFFKLFKLIFFFWILSIYYISTRYDYERLLREQTNLNHKLQRKECERLKLVKKFTEVSHQNAIKQKLEENNSNISNNKEFIRVKGER